MTTERNARFTVITNPDYDKQMNLSQFATEPDKNIQKSYITTEEKETSEKLSYHTNPMYEKLLQFQQEQKRKRFTVDDLLKW